MTLNLYMSPHLVAAFGLWLIALLIKSLIEFVTG